LHKPQGVAYAFFSPARGYSVTLWVTEAQAHPHALGGALGEHLHHPRIGLHNERAREHKHVYLLTDLLQQ
jgi:hypothetical protein